EVASERAGYRLSVAHKAQDGYPTAAGTDGNDFLFSNKGHFRGAWKPSERTTLDLFVGGTWDTQGVVDAANPQGRFRHHFQMLKHSYAAGPNSSIHALLARRDDSRTFDPLFQGPLHVREYQYDGEIAHNLDSMSGRMHTVYGAGFRYTGVYSAGIFAGRPAQKNAVLRGFASQSWQVLPRLNLIGAFSLEDSDTGGAEPAYQFAAVATPRQNHVLRASYGLAPTIPTLYQKAANQQATSQVLLVGNPAMRPQRLRSYEASYQGSFADRRLLLEANVFYMDIDALGETIVKSFVSVPSTLLTLSFDNENKALARGAEVKGTYRWDAMRSVYANYTYESISDAKGKTNVVRGTPPHKLNFGGAAALGRGFSLGLNAGYQDAHALYSQATGRTLDVHAYWRVDGRLAFKPKPGMEWFVACQNMTRSRHVEFPEGLVVPRTYQAGLALQFGAGGEKAE
ncbi:MAG: TonB-dependent receptor, partial [Elusimicrobia bacterium]|nr:TonB-dependent receptor [Elusimicrobiota bacterium]